MITPELSNYIKKAKAAGMSDEQIKNALLEIGWTESDINEELGFPEVSAANGNSSQKVSNKTIFIAVGIALLIFFAIFIAGVISGFMNARNKAKENLPKKPSEETSVRSSSLDFQANANCLKVKRTIFN